MKKSDETCRCRRFILDWEAVVQHMAPTKTKPRLNAQAFLAKVGTGRTPAEHRPAQVIFSQGDAADAIFYIHKGKVKLTAVSNQGKEAIIAILSGG